MPQEDQARIAALEQELAQAKRELEQFVYSASHDLRAPLRAIGSLVEWITEDLEGNASEESQQHLRLLADRVRRMDRLLESMVEYSRVGRKDGEPEEVDVGALVAQIVRGLELPDAFVVEVGPMPTVFTPRAALERVLRHLIDNAHRHHDRDGGRIEVRARDQGDRICVEVKDDGPGIPPDKRERAFAPFQTLKRRDEVEGSGMGLPIVIKTVERIGGGALELESEGRGCCFRFRWPAARSAGGTP